MQWDEGRLKQITQQQELQDHQSGAGGRGRRGRIYTPWGKLYVASACIHAEHSGTSFNANYGTVLSTHTHTQLLAGSSSARVPQTKPPVPSSSFSSNPPPPTTPSSSSAGWAGKKRARTFDLDDNTKRRRTTPYSARQAGEKQHNKGLRHFSQRVCEKVREKGTTTYNEVGCYSSVCVTFPTTCSLLHVLYS